MQAWFAQVAPVVKKNAGKQLVTTGIDGFYQTSNCASDVYAPEAPVLGQASPTSCTACMEPRRLQPGTVRGTHVWHWFLSTCKQVA